MVLKNSVYKRSCYELNQIKRQDQYNPEESTTSSNGAYRELAVSTYEYHPISDIKDSITGLPKPSSHNEMVARFELLKGLTHPNLCEYVEMVTTISGRLYIISEHPTNFLSQQTPTISQISDVACQCIEALCFLKDKGIQAIGNISPNIIRTVQNNEGINQVKLAGYGLNYLTDFGRDIVGPIGEFEFMALEVMDYLVDLEPNVKNEGFDSRADMWSIGLVLSQWYSGINLIEGFLQFKRPETKGVMAANDIYLGLSQMVSQSDVLGEFIGYTKKMLENTFRQQKDNKNGDDEMIQEDGFEGFIDFIINCLQPDPTKRLFPHQLAQHPFPNQNSQPNILHHKAMATFSETIQHLTLDQLLHLQSDLPISKLSLDQVFQLWKIDHDLEGEFKNWFFQQAQIWEASGLDKVPMGLSYEGEGQNGKELGVMDDPFFWCIGEYYRIDTSKLISNLNKNISSEPKHYPAINFDHPIAPEPYNDDVTHEGEPAFPSFLYPVPAIYIPNQYLVIPSAREQDPSYQLHRTTLFNSLMQQYPASEQEIILQAKVDIPPLLRGPIYACILGVKGDYKRVYRNIELGEEGDTDRQIDVDIPRCHQYHPLLASTEGQNRLAGMVKRWCRGTDGLVYWQGLDSIAAAFLSLNFDDEALAYACLNRFISQFLANMFVPDNTNTLRSQLSLYHQLLVYHDPELALHTQSIGFHPQLYAIPWFLTLFSHTFPIHKLVRLWDRILLAPPAFVTMVAIAIVSVQRDAILKSDFNDCILLFSHNVSDIDVDQCLSLALQMFYDTPKSALVLPDASDIARTYQPIEGSIPNQLAASEIGHDLHDVIQSIPAQVWGFAPANGSVPHLTLEDFFDLCAHTVVIDIRPHSLYVQGHHTQSVHLHIPSSHHKYYATMLAPLASHLNSQAKKYAVVVAETDEEAHTFTVLLVKLFVKRVAMLGSDTSDMVCRTDPIHASKAGLEVCRCTPKKQPTPQRIRPKSDQPIPPSNMQMPNLYRCVKLVPRTRAKAESFSQQQARSRSSSSVS